MRMYKPVNYQREAFVHPLNIGVLGVAFLTVFFMGGPGLVSHVIFSFILGLELIYLGVAPQSPHFRNNMRRRFMENRRHKAAGRKILEKIDQDNRERFILLKNHVNCICENIDRLPCGSQVTCDSFRENLHDLSSKYLRMLEVNDRYKNHLHKTDQQQLNDKIKEEKKNIRATSSEKLLQGRKRRLQVLRKRLRKSELTKEKNMVCESGLETIDDTIRYIYEQLITMSDAELIDSGLDDLLSEVVETSQIMDELLSTFEDIGSPDVESGFKNSDEATNDNDAGHKPVN